MNHKSLVSMIAVWKEAKTSYEIAYNNAVTYDDRGAKEFAEDMIAYSQKRIDELKRDLENIKKAV